MSKEIYEVYEICVGSNYFFGDDTRQKDNNKFFENRGKAFEYIEHRFNKLKDELHMAEDANFNFVECDNDDDYSDKREVGSASLLYIPFENMLHNDPYNLATRTRKYEIVLRKRELH